VLSSPVHEHPLTLCFSGSAAERFRCATCGDAFSASNDTGPWCCVDGCEENDSGCQSTFCSDCVKRTDYDADLLGVDRLPPQLSALPVVTAMAASLLEMPQQPPPLESENVCLDFLFQSPEVADAREYLRIHSETEQCGPWRCSHDQIAIFLGRMTAATSAAIEYCISCFAFFVSGETPSDAIAAAQCRKCCGKFCQSCVQPQKTLGVASQPWQPTYQLLQRTLKIKHPSNASQKMKSQRSRPGVADAGLLKLTHLRTRWRLINRLQRGASCFTPTLLDCKVTRRGSGAQAEEPRERPTIEHNTVI